MKKFAFALIPILTACDFDPGGKFGFLMLTPLLVVVYAMGNFLFRKIDPKGYEKEGENGFGVWIYGIGAVFALMAIYMIIWFCAKNL